MATKVSLVKDVQGQVRRDAQEQKEAYYSQWVLERTLQMVDVQGLVGKCFELSLSFNVLVDDGNLPCVLTQAALDLLKQLEQQDEQVLKKRDTIAFTVMVLQS